MTPRRAPGGFTMVELMLALVVASIVMTATLSVFRSQTKSFQTGSERVEISQNLRYAVNTIERMLRTTGAGVASQQPMFVYGGNDIVAFNTNYTSEVDDKCAVNVNPDAPTGSFEVLPLASAYVLPNTAFAYPAMNYPIGACQAETILFYFRPDSSTPVLTDFVLMQRVNAMPADVVARNVEAYPGRPFFEYFVHPVTLAVPPAARDSLVQANVAGSGIVLPIRHSVAVHGSAADSAGDASNSFLADSVKAVRINIRVTNGLTGIYQRVRDLSSVVSLPNNGLVQLKTCGSGPLFAGALVAVPNVALTPPSVTLQWPASADEVGGETDVMQYNIYRRLVGDPSFGTAFITIPSGLHAFTDNDVIAATDYEYAVAAQDCTPAESIRLISNAVRPN